MAQVVTAIDKAIADAPPRIATRVLAMFAKFAPAKRNYGPDEREQTVWK